MGRNIFSPGSRGRSRSLHTRNLILGAVAVISCLISLVCLARFVSPGEPQAPSTLPTPQEGLSAGSYHTGFRIGKQFHRHINHADDSAYHTTGETTSVPARATSKDPPIPDPTSDSSVEDPADDLLKLSIATDVPPAQSSKRDPPDPPGSSYADHKIHAGEGSLQEATDEDTQPAAEGVDVLEEVVRQPPASAAPTRTAPDELDSLYADGDMLKDAVPAPTKPVGEQPKPVQVDIIDSSRDSVALESLPGITAHRIAAARSKAGGQLYAIRFLRLHCDKRVRLDTKQIRTGYAPHVHKHASRQQALHPHTGRTWRVEFGTLTHTHVSSIAQQQQLCQSR